MAQGTLFVTVRSADSAFPVPTAEVRVFSPDGTFLGEDRVTSENGSVSRDFTLDAPERVLTLSPRAETPYATYDVRITAEGFYSFFIRGVQIFAEERSELPVEMFPRGQSLDEVIEYDIGPHALRQTPELRKEFSEDETARVLSEVYIPQRITVHLGAPSASASNVSVPFADYIKNVASSEVYPTWPESSLRANILCQISLALNRVFTEWYPSRGYNFNITNSTSYDQYFVYGRNIYDSVSRIVDEIFNEYIRRPGRIDPYFAEYCNGSSVTCAGLSQWGTVSLAQDGLSPLEILQFYYGNVEVVETNVIRAIESSYPGSPLSRGSSGQAVKTIQQQLNRIRVNYPAIPAITTIDGIFGTETRNAVVAFQRIFNLTADGVVGKSTWYRISYIYVAVKKLAELNSEGERPQYDDNSYPGILQFGDTGTSVQNLQFYLKTIAAFNPFIPDLAIDGRFGRATENAVRAFQSYYGLYVDGIVGENTWNRIVGVYLDVTEEGRLTLRTYPGYLLRQGSSGDNVLYVQMLLNRIRPVFVTIPSVSEDGVFGSRTRLAVREFQRVFGLGVDGIVGRNTWNALNRVYGSVVSECLDDKSQVSGRVLRYGSSGSDVRALQEQLQTARRSLAPIPAIRADGLYGRNTENAVRVFQGLLGLTRDGVAGPKTRTRVNTVSQAVRAGCLPTASVREAEPLSLPAFSGSEEEEETLSFPAFSGSEEEEETFSLPAFSGSEEEEELFPVAFLCVGSRGEEVRKLKQTLWETGFLENLGDEDLFGPETYRAVIRFQAACSLSLTGEVDNATRKALFS